MTALAAARRVSRMGQHAVLDKLYLPVAAAANCHAGGLAVIEDGYVKPAAAGINLKPVGIFERDADNSAGTAGALSVEVRAGVYPFKNSATTDAVTQADVGRLVYMVDDQTVARTSGIGTRAPAGILKVIEDSLLYVAVSTELVGSPDEIGLIAAGDYTAKQYFAVTIDSNQKAALAGAGVTCIGVLQNAPNTGELAIVKVSGITKLVCGGVVAKASLVASNAAGKGAVATKSTVNTSDAGAAADPVVGSSVLGIALVNAAVDGDQIDLLISRMGGVPTTAA